MQMIFSGAGIGGSHATLSSAWSAGRRAASSASLVSASAAMTSRKVGNCLLQRAERSTTPRSVTAPYLAEPSTAKVAMRGATMDAPGRLRSAFAGGHAFGLEDGNGLGRHQGIDKSFGGFFLLG